MLWCPGFRVHMVRVRVGVRVRVKVRNKVMV